mmetsp:Transcript_56471/g.132455  ORF Transcript_56471/g.132455 Transcript_56471/m.132455 type:complete len:97 (-) Transcript_56471:164-454(-)
MGCSTSQPADDMLIMKSFMKREVLKQEMEYTRACRSGKPTVAVTDEETCDLPKENMSLDGSSSFGMPRGWMVADALFSYASSSEGDWNETCVTFEI